MSPLDHTPTSHSPNRSRQGCLKGRFAWAMAAATAFTLLLSGCASNPDFWPSKKAGSSRGQVISVNDEIWTISFRADDNASTSGSALVDGQLLIQSKGKVIQSIDHKLSQSAASGDIGQWLTVEDVNNDGLPDILITETDDPSKTNPIKSLYLLDAQSKTFQLQKQISNLGDIDKLSGCVVVTASNKQETPPRTYCYSNEQKSWLEIRRSSAKGGDRCNIKTHSLAECRGMRNQRDGEMRRAVDTYIDAKSKTMVEENRKTSVQRFASSLRGGHKQWLLYRDARCSSYVIEYNFPASDRQFEMEACKLDLSALQLQHYSTMLSSIQK